MFDNIIGQDQIVERLIQDITSGTLPHSLLFYGEPYCGKSSTALECARVLSCEYSTRGEWGCQCPSCTRQRVIADSDTLLLGPRYFIQEIRGSAEVFRRMDETFARYMVIRSVRKLLRRFDSVLWEGEEQKIKKVRGLVESAADLISEIEPGNGDFDNKQREKFVEDISETCSKIVKGINLNHIPIHQVRNATFWAHTSGQGRKKVVILEGADAMLEGARNAMLKVLEEPPEDVYFILLTSNKGGIIQTIQSRVRPYGFASRSKESSAMVLEKIFREKSNEYSTLKEYFYAFDFSLDVLKNETEDFLSKAMDNRGPSFEPSTLKIVQNKSAFIPFLEGLTQRFSQLLRESADTRLLMRIEKWTKEINRMKTSVESFNQNHYLLVEKLFYFIRNN